MDSFRVIDKNKIVWLNLTSSGNETAAHLLKNNPMTIMFCDFDGKPLILRLYGKANTFHNRDYGFERYINLFDANVGSRQIFEMEVDLVQTSSGFGVPLMEFKQERTVLPAWAEKLGKVKIEEYWENKNVKIIDGFETNIFES